MSRHTEMARKMQAVWGLYGRMDKQRHVTPYILDCVLAITWSEPSWLAERTLDILKSPYWLLSKMENECSQDISKACSLESIILGFTLPKLPTEIKDMESSQSSRGRTVHMTFVKLRVWSSLDPRSVCKIHSLPSFTQLDVFEGSLLLDCKL